MQMNLVLMIVNDLGFCHLYEIVHAYFEKHLSFITFYYQTIKKAHIRVILYHAMSN